MDKQQIVEEFIRLRNGAFADDLSRLKEAGSALGPEEALEVMAECAGRYEHLSGPLTPDRLSPVFYPFAAEATMHLAAHRFLDASTTQREAAPGRLWSGYVHYWLERCAHGTVQNPNALAGVLGHDALADEAARSQFPIGKMVKLAAAHIRYLGPHPALAQGLARLASNLRGAPAEGEPASPPGKQAKAILKDIDFALDDGPLGRMPDSPFKEALQAQIIEAGADPETWRAVVDLAYKAYAAAHERDDGFPSLTPIGEKIDAGWRPPFRDVAQKAASALEQARFETVFPACLRAYAPKRAGADRNVAVVVGMISLCPALNSPALAQLLGFHAPRCFQGAKALEAQTAYAALYALELLGRPGLEQLALLNGRLKHDYAAELVSALLRAAASRSAENQDDAGRALAMFEERNLPDFGLDANGQKRVAFAGGSALIETVGREVRLSWFGPGDKPRKSMPTAVKRGEAGALKDLKGDVKALQSALTSAAGKIERLYLSGARARPFGHWRVCFAGHPLMRGPAGRLIWTIRTAPEPTRALWRDGFEDAEGGRLPTPPDDAAIELWHPLDSPTLEVTTWRRRIEALGLRQPFKQAHREVYPITEAERRTRTYSNRFAAHILRQHQFNRIAGAREWDYHLQGGWGSDKGSATRKLESLGLLAEYFVAPVWPEGGPARGGALETLDADHVRFVQDVSGESVPLEEVPPLAFSEIMRDVDLFVSVASIGADPTWTDSGQRPPSHIRYWDTFAFGSIAANVSALARKEFLESLAPQLTIAAACTLSGRYLEVQGKLNRYQIHLGSGASRIAGSNRYLCITLARDIEDGIALPFEGDSVLSIILAKAFLLANDDAITDPTILSQLRR